MAVATSLRRSGEIQRLGDEVKCTELERAHGGFHVAVRGDHGDRHARRILLNPFHQIQPVAVRQPHVREAQIEPLGLEQSLCRADRSGDREAQGPSARRVMDSSSQMIRLVIDDEYGRFRHGCIVASAVDPLALSLPALRIAEHDPENAAAADPRLVQQNGAVQLAEFAGDEQAEAGTALSAGEKRLEDAIGRLRLDPGAAVGDLEIRAIARVQPAQA